MKKATSDLPEIEQGENISDYKDHLIVVEQGWLYKTGIDTAYGQSEAVVGSVWAYTGDGENNGWKSLGSETMIFQKTLRRQLQDAGNAEDFGAKLVQGTKREGQRANPNEWAFVAPSGDEEAILDAFTTAI